MDSSGIDENRRVSIRVRMEIDPDRLDWAHLRSFLATAETASLSAAARKLGLTQPTLSRQVAALEKNLSVLLFERVGRGLELTDAGRELLAHVREMGDAAQKVAMTAASQRSDISGEVRITASDINASTFLPKIVLEVRKRAPGLSIEIVATNDISDLMRREADIAIRHVRPEQPDLVARLVREVLALGVPRPGQPAVVVGRAAGVEGLAGPKDLIPVPKKVAGKGAPRTPGGVVERRARPAVGPPGPEVVDEVPN